jgi:integrase
MKSRPASLRRWLQLWRLYGDFRKGQIEASTYLRDYKKFELRLVKLKKEAPHLSDAIAIRDYMLENYAADTVRRSLQQLNACGKWAVESGHIKTNPWAGLQKQIRRPPPGPDAWAAFTAAERDAIISAFDAQKPQYAAWVRFLFYTGCRPEEAAALRWDHIAIDYTEIQFREARPNDVKVAKQTKSHKITRFPCNPRLQRLLKSLAPAVPNRGALVLTGPKGGHFDYTNFQTKTWKPLVTELVAEGRVAVLLTQYHCRHTWITLALAAGMSVNDVSYLARVSVDVIYRHYVGRNRTIEIPEF